MATHPFRILIDEIRTSIKQTFDDKDVSRAQVAFWIIIVGNRLLSQHISKRSSGQFLNTYIVPLITATETNGNMVKGRKYIELPAQIFDYDNDDGVEYMAYYDPDEECKPEYQQRTIHRTTATQVQWLNKDKRTKPSVKNPYFWRAGDVFNIIGLERAPIDFVEIGIYQTISSVNNIDIDAPFQFPEELLEVLKNQVTALARYSFLFPGDQRNDGTDTAADPQSKQPVPKIVSVNDNNQ